MSEKTIVSSETTSCIVIGGGPAGMILGYLLARANVPVVVLESHHDFDRDFRGDTVHTNTLNLLHDAGIAERLLETVPHARVQKLRFFTGENTYTIADFATLKPPYNYLAVIPQVRFLDFLASESRPLPSYTLKMRANVRELIEEEGRVVGVRYQAEDGWHELRGQIVVSADGRHSTIRKGVGFEQIKSSPPMDVIWFRVPKIKEHDSSELLFRATLGHLMVMIDREDHWQIALIVQKDGFREIKARGIEPFKELLQKMAPGMEESFASLENWNDMTVLIVEAGRLKKWYRPGLLFIGDSAHTMSPVGGVGINYAIQDAVAAANALTEPLRSGKTIEEEHLAEVQKEREFAVKFIQFVQTRIQDIVVKRALSTADAGKPFKLPFFLKLPFVGSIVSRIMGYGIHVTRWKKPEGV